MQDLTKAEAWQHLIFGTFSRKEIDDAVRDRFWQRLRIRLLGTSLQEKLWRLEEFVAQPCVAPRKRQICVTNYVYALKRGGLIK